MPTLLSDRQLVLVAHRRQDVIVSVTDGLEARIGVLWDQVGGVTDEALVRFSRAASDLVVRTQRWAIGEAEAYIRNYVYRATGDPKVLTGQRIIIDDVLAGLRGGVSPLDVYGRPVITARKALSDGKAFADAMRIARTRATSTAATDLALASRSGAHDAMQLQPHVVAYRRVPNAAACPFCLVAASQRYHKAALLPLHGRCHCTVAPILGHSDPGRIVDRESRARLKAAGEIDKITAQRQARAANSLQPEISVHEHGELGPVLAKKGDHFTGPAAVAD